MPNQQTQTTPAGDRLKPSEYIGYALGDSASNFFFQTFNIFLTYYYVDVWGLAAAAITVLLWPVLWVDPLGTVGNLADGLIAAVLAAADVGQGQLTHALGLVAHLLPDLRATEVGRASCRERVSTIV